MHTQRRYIEVHAHWVGLEQPTIMGVLYAVTVRGKKIFSFTYDSEWLIRQNITLDPALQLLQGIQYAPDKTDNTQDLSLVKEVAAYFRVQPNQA